MAASARERAEAASAAPADLLRELSAFGDVSPHRSSDPADAGLGAARLERVEAEAVDRPERSGALQAARCGALGAPGQDLAR